MCLVRVIISRNQFSPSCTKSVNTSKQLRLCLSMTFLWAAPASTRKSTMSIVSSWDSVVYKRTHSLKPMEIKALWFNHLIPKRVVIKRDLVWLNMIKIMTRSWTKATYWILWMWIMEGGIIHKMMKVTLGSSRSLNSERDVGKLWRDMHRSTWRRGHKGYVH